MKNPLFVAGALACLVAGWSVDAAQAQGSSASASRSSQYGEGDDERGDDRFGLGIGVGVVDPEGEGELYYTAALRIRILDGDDDQDQGDGNWRYDSSREIRAYIEPEIGYWETDEPGRSESDLSLGINAIGVVPGQVVDYFFGVGVGVHSIDTKIDSTNPALRVDESDTHLGGNFQIGLDIRLGEAVSAFGVGRFDLIEGVEDTVQGKVYLGLRFRF